MLCLRRRSCLDGLPLPEWITTSSVSRVSVASAWTNRRAAIGSEFRVPLHEFACSWHARFGDRAGRAAELLGKRAQVQPSKFAHRPSERFPASPRGSARHAERGYGRRRRSRLSFPSACLRRQSSPRLGPPCTGLRGSRTILLGETICRAKGGGTSKTPRPALPQPSGRSAGRTYMSPYRRTMAHSVKCERKRDAEQGGARRPAEPIAAAQGLPLRQHRFVTAVAKEANSRALRLFGLLP